MSAIERGPLNLNELTDEQRQVLARLTLRGWTPKVLGYATGCLYLSHHNGRQCAIHPDGHVEAIEESEAA